MVSIPKLNTLQIEQKIPFKVEAPFEPTGDQPQAIEKLARGIEKRADGAGAFGGYGNGQDVHDCQTD